MRFFFPMLVSLVLAACASTRPAATDAPDDFTLSVTVMSSSPGLPGTPRGSIPARYVIEADRFLRAATGPGSREEAFPTLTRHLSSEQFAAVYRQFRDSPLVDTASPVAVSHLPSSADLVGRSLVIVSYKHQGVRRTLLIDDAENPAEAASAHALADTLAGLAWLKEPAAPSAPVLAPPPGPASR